MYRIYYSLGLRFTTESVDYFSYLVFALLFTERNVLTVRSLRIVRNVLMVTFVDGAATMQIQV